MVVVVGVEKKSGAGARKGGRGGRFYRGFLKSSLGEISIFRIGRDLDFPDWARS